VALVDGAEQLFAAGKLLVEVARVQAGARAQRLDRGAAVSLAPEQLEAGVEQLFAPLRTPLRRRLAAVSALAGCVRRNRVYQPIWRCGLTDGAGMSDTGKRSYQMGPTVETTTPCST
jgi:hypothetical protein